MQGVAGVLGTEKIYTGMVQRLHLTMPTDMRAIAIDVLISLTFGVLIAYVYAAMRPRFGAGMGTALRAAIIVGWLPLNVFGVTYQVELGMMPARDGVVLSASALVMCCIAGLIAGALYREAGAAKAATA